MAMSAWGKSGNSSLAAGLRKARNAFTPYDQVVAQPPAGSYDPNLDAQENAVNRGLVYTTQDVNTAGSRAEQDYGQTVHGLTTTRDRSLSDLLRGHTRAGEDFDRSGTRMGEDHTTNTQSIDRSYQRLGTSQTGAAAQQGVATQGSTLANALRARRENQGIDQAAEDRSFTRGTENLSTARTREGEDYGTNTGRVTEDYNDPNYGHLARAGTDYQRGVDDRATTLGRAGTEAAQYGLDSTAQRNFQAQQSGYQAPPKPSNEFEDAKGSYKLVIRGSRRYKVRADGSEDYAGVHR